jgi:hypothetical protein
VFWFLKEERGDLLWSEGTCGRLSEMVGGDCEINKLLVGGVGVGVGAMFAWVRFSSKSVESKRPSLFHRASSVALISALTSLSIVYSHALSGTLRCYCC